MTSPPTAGLRLDAPTELDPSQEAVVAAVLGGAPGVVVVAGAPGTGKSHTAQALVSSFVAGGGSPDAVLLLAPTRVAAAAVSARLNAHVTQTRIEPLVSTASSLAFSILRQAAASRGEPVPRLLTGAEQDAIIRDLLQGHADGEAPMPPWPQDMTAALSTRGFRGQLRDLLMRAVEQGIDATTLKELAQTHRRPQWHAAADVLSEYEQVTALASPGAFDPAYICVAASAALEDDPAMRAALTAHLGLLVVDDAQELSASAATLLTSVQHAGMRIALLGDGDAVVQGFRGALPHRFVEVADELAMLRATLTQRPRPQHLVLGTNHRLPEALAELSGRAADRIGVSTAVSHRHPTSKSTSMSTSSATSISASSRGSVEIAVTHTPGQEAELVAHRLRRAHVIDGLGWSQMAVIARSGSQHDAVRRALSMAGVPVHAGLSGVPLAFDPAAAPILAAFDMVVGWAKGERTSLRDDEIVELLTSPMGRADPVAMRRLRRAVRRAAPLDDVDGPARSVDELMGQWVLDRAWLVDDSPGESDLEPLARVAGVLWAGRTAALETSKPVTAHTVLWSMWQATGLASLWERAALAGGVAGAHADRHLDAVIALFDAAQDYTHRLGRADLGVFAAHLRGQEVAPDSLADRGVRAQEVSVLTPQAAAGREWDFVAVVGVQEGVWPNLRLRGSLLGAEALVEVLGGRSIDGPEGLRSAHNQVWNDELRQFYVALTRSRDRVLVTAVASVDDQPSVYLDLIDPDVEQRSWVSVPARLTLRGVVAQLRQDLVLAHREKNTVARDVFAQQLVRLARESVPWADPSSWLDGREPSTDADRVPDGSVPVSPSKVQSFTDCELRWLLTSHGGDAPSTLSASVGTLVHDIVAEHPQASLESLISLLDERWGELRQDQSWVSARARDLAHDMMGRFVTYRELMAEQERELVGVEVATAVEVGRARIVGRVDRLERAADGSFVVIDLKTGTSKPAAHQIDTHPQLATYQVALSEGGFSEMTGDGPRSDGAALVHVGSAGNRAVSVQRQPALDTSIDPQWAHDLVERTAQGMAGSQFSATLGSWCRTCVVKTCCPMQPEGDRG